MLLFWLLILCYIIWQINVLLENYVYLGEIFFLTNEEIFVILVQFDIPDISVADLGGRIFS